MTAKTPSFTEIQKGLNLVRINHVELRNARASALRTSLGDQAKIDVAKALVDDNFDAKALSGDISRAMAKKGTSCASLHLCIALERHLKLPTGTLFRAVYHTEKENWGTLHAAYGLPASAPILQRNGTLPPTQPASTATLAEIMVQKGFVNGKGVPNLSKLTKAVYPTAKDNKKAGALRKRLSGTLNNGRQLTEQDAVEISNALGIPASSLLGKTGTSAPANVPAPVAAGPPAVSSAPPVPATASEGGLQVAISVPSLAVDTTVGLSYDPARRTFNGAANGSTAHIRKNGSGFVLAITTEIALPPESAQALLAILLP